MKLIVFVLALLYALLPTDLIPDMLIGWGWIDDLIILGLILRYVLTGKLPSFLNQYLRTRQADSRDDPSKQQKYQSYESFKNTYAQMTPYEIIGVTPSASKDEIRAAYRKLANQYHPDKVQHLGEEFQQLAEIKFKIIQDAYQGLMNGR